MAVSVNIKKADGSLQKIAGNTVILDATASEIREGTFTMGNSPSGWCTVNITFDIPMPDTEYVVNIEGSVFSSDIITPWRITNKTVNGFELGIYGNVTNITGKYYAIRLVKLEGYTELQNKVNNPDSTPTKNSTNLVTSGGVYDAIASASKIFINSESAWNELDAETKATYQVAIFTDKPNVNAVDSTDGSTAIVGEPNKRWVGTQAEWDNLTAAEKAEFEIVCFTDDNGANGKDIYSTTETKTNKVWIDGKPIYRKVVTGLGDTYDNWNYVLLDASVNVDRIISCDMVSNTKTGATNGAVSSGVQALIYADGTVHVKNNMSHTDANKAVYVVEYTKTTDS
jgi:hypothetical protein